MVVTAAGTPLGRRLVEAMLEWPEVDRVVAVDRALGPVFGSHPRLHTFDADLRSARAAHDLCFGPLAQLAADTLVHQPGPAAQGHAATTRELVHLVERHPTLRRLVLRSSGDVYHIDQREPNLLDEDAPLELSPHAAPGLRERLAADLAVAVRAGLSSRHLLVLRCAEVLAAGTDSPLWDYLSSRVCLRPLGFDPMVNLLAEADLLAAVRAALSTPARGCLNIPGGETLPLSRLVRAHDRLGVPLPGPLVAPAYRLRSALLGRVFDYQSNARRFHFGALLDGSRARRELGYEPRHTVTRGATGTRDAP